MNLFKNSFVFISSLLLLGSCSMVGEDAVTVPAYIYIPGYTFTTDSLNEGSNYNKFTDMWISDDGKLVGAIGLPSLLPIQKQGLTKVRVDAGIILTGQDNQRAPYPFIQSYVETRDLKPGVIDTVIPKFEYLPNIDAKFIEDYDRVGRAFKIYEGYYAPGDTIIPDNGDKALRPGSFSGRIELAPSHQTMLLITNVEYELTSGGPPVYLEIDYNSNLPLDIGYYHRDPKTTEGAKLESVIQTFPSTGWKKLYINLTNEVAPRASDTKYMIYIGIFNQDNIVPSIYIDNVKLLCLKG